MDQGELDKMFDALRATAQQMATDYISIHCPPELQPHMAYYMDQYSLPIKNGAAVQVKYNDGSTSVPGGAPATATVIGGALINVMLTTPHP